MVSVSATVNVPEPSEVSSVAPPVEVPPMVAASLIPVIVMVMVWAVPSELVTTKVSLMVAANARA